LSTEYNQNVVDVSEGISVPTPRTKRAKVPKIQTYTVTECSSVKLLENFYELLDECVNKQVIDKRPKRRI
jgi:hypothetical protein